MTINPTIPPDWFERSTGFVDPSPANPWSNEASTLLRTLGPKAIALELVQYMVAQALDLKSIAHSRNLAWIRSIPDSEWSVAEAWSELATKRSSIFESHHQIRAIDDELDTLTQLAAMGFNPIRTPRQQGRPDWNLQRGNQAIWVEVKSKASPETALDLLHTSLCGRQLIDESIRHYSWNLDTYSNSRGVGSWKGKHIDLIIEWIFSRAPFRSSQLARAPNDPATEAPPHLYQLLDLGHPGLQFELEGNADRENWVFPSHRCVAHWAPNSLSKEHVDAVSRILSRSAFKNGRQLKRFPDRTLFLIRWHAPLQWDEAIAKTPAAIQTILDRLTLDAARSRTDQAIGLWVSCFHENYILFNRSGARLIGRPSWSIVRPPVAGVSVGL